MDLLLNPGLLAAGSSRTAFEWGRIETPSDWLAPLAVAALAAAWTVWIYRRDTRELKWPLRWLLGGLRLATVAGLLVVYLQPQLRREQELESPSRALVLADTSLSMGLADQTGSSPATVAGAATTRSQQVIELLRDSPLVEELRGKHDVVLAAFDESLRRVAVLPRRSPELQAAAELASGAISPGLQTGRLWLLGAGCALLGLLTAVVPIVRWPEAGRLSGVQKLGVMGSVVALGAIVICSVQVVRSTTTPELLALFHLRGPQAPQVEGSDGAAQEATANDGSSIDWEGQFNAQGRESRIGAALRQLLDEERNTPVSAVILLSDGQQTSGVEPAAVVAALGDRKVPVHVVGIGSDVPPQSVRISEFAAPQRAYPNDSFSVTAFVQAQQLAGREATVALEIRPAGAAADAPWRLIDELPAILGVDGEAVPVKFDLAPEETGRQTLRARLLPMAEDDFHGDDEQLADVDIVDRKTRVLLFAGGPAREYQYVRNLLKRDSDVLVDVLLQSGGPGISQDANLILEGFPSSASALADYDAIVAFDPDWRDLTDEQVALLENWVAQQAGGLIVEAGPVNTDRWNQDPRMQAIRDLYPVEFRTRFSAASAAYSDGQYGAEDPWPIHFTREGLDAEFLWLEDGPAISARAWESFAGIYGYYHVRGAKPGATVYGFYSDPRAADGDQLPVYLCGHFYGAGRVVYTGSSEFWRLRTASEAHFERLYTRLIRYVTQGRLLRGSTRGVLLVEKDRYFLGDRIIVRARLNDAQLQPLEAPEVLLEVYPPAGPGGAAESLVLLPDPAQPGSYQGQFVARAEGAYRLELAVPDSDERLDKRVQVRVPDLERMHPERHAPRLQQLAAESGGVWFDGVLASTPSEGNNPLLAVLPDRTRTVTLAGDPFALWDNPWVLCGLCGLLCVEWLVRRIVRLA